MGSSLVADHVAAELTWLCSGNDRLDRVFFVADALVQVTLIPSMVLSWKQGNYDRAAAGLYFALGFSCITWSQWKRLGVRRDLRPCMSPLLKSTRLIEASALQTGPGFQRMNMLGRAMRPLRLSFAWQGYLVAILIEVLFVVFGRRIIPSWPQLGLPWDHLIVIYQNTCIVYSARVFLTLSGLHWMSSLCVDCALHLLSDRVAEVTTWQELVQTVRAHQRLLRDMESVQGYFAPDLFKVLSVLLLFGLIGTFRLSMGMVDVSNIIICVVIFTYISTVCVTSEMQEAAGEIFYTAICNCPWLEWDTETRSRFAILVAHTIKPSKVRFRYFGAMSLQTLSNMFNNIFRYTQLLRASYGDRVWS